MEKLLVTGSTGFIGRHCLNALAAREFDVHAVFRTSPPPGPQGGIEWHQADILNSGEIARIMAKVKPAYLLHLAWHIVPGKWAQSGAIQNLAWVQASLELLKAFQEHGGKRAVFAGSCTEYDWNYGYCTENFTPTNPNSFYGLCKNSVQRLGEAFSREAGVSWAWGRIFFVYGPHEQPARLVSSVIQALLNNRNAPCTHGNQIRDYLYVQDVADALVALLESEVKGAVNIGSGIPIALKDMLHIIGRKLHREHLIQLGALAAPSYESPLVVGRIERLCHEVKWTPKIDLHQGLDLTIKWWASHLKIKNKD